MAQEQVHAKPTKRKKTEPAVEETTRASEHVTVEDVDEILDEIDSVLETNALEVVRTFRQRGGQAVRVFVETLARGLLSFPPLPVLFGDGIR